MAFVSSYRSGSRSAGSRSRRCHSRHQPRPPLSGARTQPVGSLESRRNLSKDLRDFPALDWQWLWQWLLLDLRQQSKRRRRSLICTWSPPGQIERLRHSRCNHKQSVRGGAVVSKGRLPVILPAARRASSCCRRLSAGPRTRPGCRASTCGARPPGASSCPCSGARRS